MFKRVYTDFPNLALLTNISTNGEFQVTYVQTSIGNNPLKETRAAFVLVVSLETPTVLTIDAEHVFTGAGDKICLPATKFLLCATVGNLSKLNHLCEWAELKNVLLPPLFNKLFSLRERQRWGEYPRRFLPILCNVYQNSPSKNRRMILQASYMGKMLTTRLTTRWKIKPQRRVMQRKKLQQIVTTSSHSSRQLLLQVELHPQGTERTSGNRMKLDILVR